VVVRRLMLLLLCAASACGALPGALAPARQDYEAGPMVPFAWILGDWKSETGQWHWVAAGDKIYGVGFDARAFRNGFEVMTLEEEREPGQAEGVPWLHVYEGPEFLLGVRDRVSEKRIRFKQSAAEGPPFEVTLARIGDELEVSRRRPTSQRRLSPPEILLYQAYPGAPAPELEEAERALVAAVNDRAKGLTTNGQVWAEAFAPDGTYWCERCVGGASGRASEADLSPRNSPGTFTWAPIVSRRAGDFGFTVGHISYRPRLLPGVWRGTYLSVWRRGSDGRWSMMFNTRRSAIAALPEPES